MQRTSYIVKVNNFIMMTQQLTYIICVYVERKKKYTYDTIKDDIIIFQSNKWKKNFAKKKGVNIWTGQWIKL